MTSASALLVPQWRSQQPDVHTGVRSTVYSSVTGIVSIDLAGTISPRDGADLKP